MCKQCYYIISIIYSYLYSELNSESINFISLLLLEVFFLFTLQTKRKKTSQRKKNPCWFSTPKGVKIKWMCSAIVNTIAESLLPRKLGLKSSNNARLLF